MSEQSTNYIVLKPIAERFNKVAKDISDDDIKYIIKQAMSEQIKNAFDFSKIGEITETYIEEYQDEINNMIFSAIDNRMKMPSKY
jgi:ACT domain-containing protein